MLLKNACIILVHLKDAHIDLVLPKDAQQVVILEDTNKVRYPIDKAR